MMNEDAIKQGIIETLRTHPEGLTIASLSELMGINRMTTSKYIYGLTSEELIYQRKIGPAKLCMLKEEMEA